MYYLIYFVEGKADSWILERKSADFTEFFLFSSSCHQGYHLGLIAPTTPLFQVAIDFSLFCFVRGWDTQRERGGEIDAALLYSSQNFSLWMWFWVLESKDWVLVHGNVSYHLAFGVCLFF